MFMFNVYELTSKRILSPMFVIQVRQAREMLVMARRQGLAPLQQVVRLRAYRFFLCFFFSLHDLRCICDLFKVAMGRVASCIGEVCWQICTATITWSPHDWLSLCPYVPLSVCLHDLMFLCLHCWCRRRTGWPAKRNWKSLRFHSTWRRSCKHSFKLFWNGKRYNQICDTKVLTIMF